MLAPLLLAAALVVATPERAVSPAEPQAAVGQSGPLVASNGHGWLAAWSASTYGVWASRIDDDGNVLDRPPLVISDSGSAMAIAAGTDGYLVVWVDRYDLRAAIVDGDGHRSAPVTLATSSSLYVFFHAEYVAGRYLVSWDSGTALLDERGQIVSGGARGGSFVVVRWQYDDRLHFTFEITATRVGTDGSVDAPVVVASHEAMIDFPQWTTNGSETFIVWGRRDDVRGALLGADGHVTPTPAFPKGSARLTEVASTGRGYLALLSRTDAILAVPLDRRGEALSDAVVVVKPSELLFAGNDVVHAAWNGRTMLVALWTYSQVVSSLLVDTNAWLKFVDAGGRPIDPTPGSARAELLDTKRPGLSLVLVPPNQNRPMLAAGAHGSTIAWVESLPESGRRAVYVAAVAGDAEPAPHGPPAATTSEYYKNFTPFIATNGAQTLLAWWSGETAAVAGAALLDAGAAAVPVALPDHFIVGGVVWDGNAFLVAGISRASLGSDAGQVELIRIDASGAAYAPFPLTPPNTRLSGSASIASNGDGALVTWTRTGVGTAEGVLLGRGGTTSAVLSIATHVVECRASAVGNGYVVGLSLGDMAVGWAMVSASGAVRVATPRFASRDRYFLPFPPRAAPLGDGIVLVWDDVPDLRVARTDANGELLGDTVTMGLPWPHQFDVAAEGRNARIVYTERTAGVPVTVRLMTRLILSDGAPPKRHAVR